MIEPVSSETIELYLGAIAIAASMFAAVLAAYFFAQVLIEEVAARKSYALYKKPMLKSKSKGTAGHNGERAR